MGYQDTHRLVDSLQNGVFVFLILVMPSQEATKF